MLHKSEILLYIHWDHFRADVTDPQAALATNPRFPDLVRISLPLSKASDPKRVPSGSGASQRAQKEGRPLS